MKKIIPLLICICLIFCSCDGRFEKITFEEESFTSWEEPGNASLLFEDFPENFTIEYYYRSHTFEIIRRGDEILKHSDSENIVFYRKNGELYDCWYFEQGEWGTPTYSEDEIKTVKRCFYCIIDTEGLKTDWKKTDRTETVAGMNTDIYTYTDEEGNDYECMYCAENGMVLKQYKNGKLTCEVYSYTPGVAEFDTDIPK